jgi:hypothetical protein
LLHASLLDEPILSAACRRAIHEPRQVGMPEGVLQDKTAKIGVVERSPALPFLVGHLCVNAAS